MNKLFCFDYSSLSPILVSVVWIILLLLILVYVVGLKKDHTWGYLGDDVFILMTKFGSLTIYLLFGLNSSYYCAGVDVKWHLILSNFCNSIRSMVVTSLPYFKLFFSAHRILINCVCLVVHILTFFSHSSFYDYTQ